MGDWIDFEGDIKISGAFSLKKAFNIFFGGDDCRIDVDRESMKAAKFTGSIEGSGLSYFILLAKFKEQVRNDRNVKSFTLRITNILV